MNTTTIEYKEGERVFSEKYGYGTISKVNVGGFAKGHAFLVKYDGTPSCMLPTLELKNDFIKA